MNDTALTPKTDREVVGMFRDRDTLETAIMALFDAGFDRTDISVLADHESIDVLDDQEKTLKERLFPLLDEIPYEVPLVAAGLIAIASGPVGAAVAGGLAAGLGGMAIKDFLDEATSVSDPDWVAAELAKGGLMLWVAVPDEAAETKAKTVLDETGAKDIHIHTHEAQ